MTQTSSEPGALKPRIGQSLYVGIGDRLASRCTHHALFGLLRHAER